MEITKLRKENGIPMSKQTLILLYGGRSAEREVSVLSAESVMRALSLSLAILSKHKSLRKHRVMMKIL